MAPSFARATMRGRSTATVGALLSRVVPGIPDLAPESRGSASSGSGKSGSDFARAECHDPGVSVTVLIVDDHPGFRRFARRLLEEAGFAVVGEAADGASGMAAARDLAPTAVLLDVMLPD